MVFHGVGDNWDRLIYLPVMRKNRVRMTRSVNPPTAAVAITRICPCSAAISEAETETQATHMMLVIYFKSHQIDLYFNSTLNNPAEMRFM